MNTEIKTETKWTIPESTLRKGAAAISLGVWDTLWKVVLSFLIGVLLYAIVRDFFGWGLDNSDKDGWLRSGLTVHVDYATGVNYIETPQGFLMPRLNTNGSLYISK